MTDKGTGLGAGTPIVLFPVMGKKRIEVQIVISGIYVREVVLG